MNDLDTSQTSDWKIISRVMDKCRAPKIPPLVNSIFVLSGGEKAKFLNDIFSKQCTPIMNSSVLPALNLFTDKRIDWISIQNEEIILSVRKLNPNKASGSDGILGQMLHLCDNSVVLHLKIIFQNILESSTYYVFFNCMYFLIVCTF